MQGSVPAALLREACGYGSRYPLNCSNPQIIRDQVCHQGTTPPYSVVISNASDASIALGVAGSYQNEGDVFEVNWQQGLF